VSPRELRKDLSPILKNPPLVDSRMLVHEVRNGHECTQQGSASGSWIPTTCLRYDGLLIHLRSHHGSLSSSGDCGCLLRLDKTGKTPRRDERQSVGLLSNNRFSFHLFSDVESAPMIKGSEYECCPSLRTSWRCHGTCACSHGPCFGISCHTAMPKLYLHFMI